MLDHGRLLVKALTTARALLPSNAAGEPTCAGGWRVIAAAAWDAPWDSSRFTILAWPLRDAATPDHESVEGLLGCVRAACTILESGLSVVIGRVDVGDGAPR
jgi:hypothetical protein